MQVPADLAPLDTNLRPLAARILLVQCGVALVLGLLCFALWGGKVGASSLVGGMIGIIANLYMTLNALRTARSAGAALGSLLKGQLIKIGLTVGLFLAVAKMPWLSWPAMLGSYLATLVVFWWVPLFAGPKQQAARPAAPGQDEQRPGESSK